MPHLLLLLPQLLPFLCRWEAVARIIRQAAVQPRCLPPILSWRLLAAAAAAQAMAQVRCLAMRGHREALGRRALPVGRHLVAVVAHKVRLASQVVDLKPVS